MFKNMVTIINTIIVLNSPTINCAIFNESKICQDYISSIKNQKLALIFTIEKSD